MDPGIMIPVKGYGGHERLVEMFAKEYQKMGHEVQLLITNGSIIGGCTVHGFGKEGFPPTKWDRILSLLKAWKFLRQQKENFDIVHNFGRLAYLLPILRHPIKKVMTYGREINSGNIQVINRIGAKNIFFTACSNNLLSRVQAAGDWEVVYNAIDFAKYRLQETMAEDAPLIFLGRIEKIKGCHTAIRVAKATGSRLIIAGNISPLPEEKAYFKNEVEPHVDGKQIQYIGAVNDLQKNEWLGKSKALLFPIDWNEPFGIVMIEAMACGTPVIAFNRGSVNEVVDEGITGFKINTEAEMIDAVSNVMNISRCLCRQQAKERFDVRVIAKRYMEIVASERKRVVILSTHQPAANPRALKEYETLKELGYWVKYLYSYNTDWSHRIDETKFEKGLLSRQDLVQVGGNPYKYPLKYFISRVIFRSLRTLASFTSFKNLFFARPAFPLWRNVTQYRADLYIAHYLGALPAALRASKKFGAGLIFDAEDFHRGEQAYYDKQMEDVVSIENRFLPLVNAITTASPLISAEYKKCYPRQNILTINNVFSNKYLQPGPNPGSKELKLFWFSQHIDVYRGLEIFVKALNYLPNASITLTIMGNVGSKLYIKQLLSLSQHPEKILFRNTAPPEELFAIAARFDIGLAGEIPNCKNKELCLSNKIFTYLLAGNCLLVSDMQGQTEFIESYPGIGFTYKHNDAKDLAMKIQMLYENRQLLENCKRRSLLLAKEVFNWEKEKEPWTLLVDQLLDRQKNLIAGKAIAPQKIYRTI